MVVEASPSSALKMTKPELLFELLVITFNAPPKLCGAYQFFNGNSGIQIREPVFYWLGFANRPLDQQPFFARAVTAPVIPMPFPYAHGGESRGKHLVCAFPPGDGLICAVR